MAGPQIGVAGAQSVGDQGAQNTDGRTNTQALPDDAEATLPAGLQQGAGYMSSDPLPSDTRSDEALDDDPVRLPIAGWVLDQDGTPVANIEVAASARRLARSDESGSSAGRDNSVFSDERGYFAFSDLPDGEYLLATEVTDDYDSARATVRAGVSSAVLRVTGGGGWPVTIHGVVTDEQYQPIAGVRIAPTDDGRATTHSDSAGNYDLQLTADGRSRTRTIRFTKPGYHSKTLGIRQSKLHDVTEWPLDARLEANGDGVLVDGAVMSANGTPVAGARIQLYSHRLGRSHQATSGQDGSFLMDAVDAGDDYRLWVRPRADYQDHVEEGLRIGTSGTFLPVNLQPLGTAGLRGRMVNALREPIPRYTLWMWNSAAGANRNLSVTSDSGGGFRIDDVPVGEVTFSSRGSPQFNFGGIQLEAGETATADLILDWGREELAGLVVNATGEPVASAEVKLFWSDEEQGVTSRSQRRTVTDAGGFFIFTELGPGGHTVTVSAEGYRAVRREEMPTMPGGELLIQLQETTS